MACSCTGKINSCKGHIHPENIKRAFYSCNLPTPSPLGALIHNSMSWLPIMGSDHGGTSRPRPIRVPEFASRLPAEVNMPIVPLTTARCTHNSAKLQSNSSHRYGVKERLGVSFEVSMVAIVRIVVYGIWHRVDLRPIEAFRRNSFTPSYNVHI